MITPFYQSPQLFLAHQPVDTSGVFEDNSVSSWLIIAKEQDNDFYNLAETVDFLRMLLMR